MPLRRFFLAACSVVLTLGPLAAGAQEGAPDADPVVARIDGEAIHHSEVMDLALSLPPQYQAQIAQIFPLLVERLIDFKLAGRAGRAAGLAEDEEVKERVVAAQERAIRDVYLERELAGRLTAEGLQQRYQAFLEANPVQDEQRARHILVDSEEEAREVIALLDQGADFAELAKERSTGPSGPQGGDLGYFTGDQMVPEFSEAASRLEPGSHSAEPAKTEFGWHVIKVEDRRPKAQPGFEEVEPQLREEMAREAATELFQGLRAAATIEILPAATGAAPEPAQ